MPVNPWGGYERGLASLNQGLDTMYERRRQDEEDALRRPLLRAQTEGAVLDLEERRRKIGNLRDWDVARRNLEGRLETETVPTDVPNPDYLPPREQMGPSLPRTMDVGEGAPAPVDVGMPQAPTQGLPTMAGTRPMNQDEKMSARVQLAFQHGDFDTLTKMGQWVDLTDKLEGRGAERMKKWLDILDSASDMSPQVQLEVAKRASMGMGVPQNIVEQMVVNQRMNGIATPVPDAEGNIIGNMITYREGGKRKTMFHKAEKDVAPKFSSAVTDEGVYSYDQRTGERGTRLGSAKKGVEGAVEDRAEAREEKRKVKALTEARKEVERAYGFSQFLPTAQDPSLLEKVNKGKMIVEDIIDNYKDYGLDKEPTPGKAAERAKQVIDKLYQKGGPKPAPSTAAASDKDTQIRQQLGLPVVK